MLGFRATISLEEGLRQLIEWRNKEARSITAGATA